MAFVPVFPPSVIAPPGRKIRPPITALPSARSASARAGPSDRVLDHAVLPE
jgi:hypothetical protein